MMDRMKKKLWCVYCGVRVKLLIHWLRMKYIHWLTNIFNSHEHSGRRYVSSKCNWYIQHEHWRINVKSYGFCRIEMKLVWILCEIFHWFLHSVLIDIQVHLFGIDFQQAFSFSPLIFMTLWMRQRILFKADSIPHTQFRRTIFSCLFHTHQCKFFCRRTLLFMISYIFFQFQQKTGSYFSSTRIMCCMCIYDEPTALPTITTFHIQWESPWNEVVSWWRCFVSSDIWTGWFNCPLKAWQRNIRVKHGDTRIHNVSKTHSEF